MTQTPAPSNLPPQYGPCVTLDEAKRIMGAAEKDAASKSWPMVIAIVDTAGLLVMFHRHDQAQRGSVQVAQAKARTAALYRRPTKVFEDMINGGAQRMLSMPDVLALEGGLPILKDGKVVGGIGVSGMASPQDAEVARAGLAALGA